MSDYPVKSPKAARRIEDKTVLLLTDGVHILLHKRPKEGLLAGLYEFPNVPGHLTEEQVSEYLRSIGMTVRAMTPLPSAKHIFTHIEWHMTGYLVRVSVAAPEELPDGYVSAALSEVRDNYALPSAFAKYRACLPNV